MSGDHPVRSSVVRWRNAARDSDLRATEKAVVFVIATYMNAAGECWPSVNTIANGASLSERAVRSAIGGLELAGFIRVDRSKGRKASTYRIPTLHQLHRSGRPTLHLATANGASGAPEREKKRGAALTSARAACQHCGVGAGNHSVDCPTVSEAV